MAAIPMATFALKFGAPEYTMLVAIGLVAASLISSGSHLRAFSMALVGIALGMVGSDASTGQYRFVATDALADGISLVSLAMGLFGLSEIIRNAASHEPRKTQIKLTLRDIFPNRAKLRSTLGGPLDGTLTRYMLLPADGVVPQAPPQTENWAVGAAVLGFCAVVIFGAWLFMLFDP